MGAGTAGIQGAGPCSGCLVEIMTGFKVRQKTKNPPFHGRADAYPFVCPRRDHIRFRDPPCPGRQVGVGVDPSLNVATILATYFYFEKPLRPLIV